MCRHCNNFHSLSGFSRLNQLCNQGPHSDSSLILTLDKVQTPVPMFIIRGSMCVCVGVCVCLCSTIDLSYLSLLIYT